MSSIIRQRSMTSRIWHLDFIFHIISNQCIQTHWYFCWIFKFFLIIEAKQYLILIRDGYNHILTWNILIIFSIHYYLLFESYNFCNVLEKNIKNMLYEKSFLMIMLKNELYDNNHMSQFHYFSCIML